MCQHQWVHSPSLSHNMMDIKNFDGGAAKALHFAIVQCMGSGGICPLKSIKDLIIYRTKLSQMESFGAVFYHFKV